MPVTIYSTPTCAYCQQAKDFFKEQEVEYNEINIYNNEEKAQEMLAKSGQMAVPVIIVSADLTSSGQEEMVIGFQREKLLTILKKEK